MSYQVLARKWRPRIFREMVGQEHVLKALINALDHNRLHHAYLFTGTRGVGKTSIARILAKCLNCESGVSSEPCGTCSACVEISEGRFVDLIEVDAASRTKVEDTRELLDNVQYAPTRGRYKIYLIDEVHMLSSHSFNALLKTLEEPPEHIKFLLATTDPQKLPVTILSRCLQFNLKNMSPERIVEHLKDILGKEVVPFEEAGLWLLARSADGSMRDALSLTDQAISFGSGKIVEADVAAMLGTIDHQLIQKLMEGLIQVDGQSILEAVAGFAEHAPDFDAALSDLLALLHRIAIAQALPEALDNSYGDRKQVLEYAHQLAPEDVQLYYQMGLMGRRDLHLAPDPRSGFEMALLRMLAFKPQGVADVPTRPLTESVAKSESMTTESMTATEESASVKKPQTDTAPANSQAGVSVVVKGEPQSRVDAAPGIPTPRELKQQVKAIVGREGVATELKPVREEVPGAVQARRDTVRDSTTRDSTTPDSTTPGSTTRNNTIQNKPVSLEEFSPAHWISVYHQLGIKGILQSTAANSVLLGREGNQLHFALDESKGSLFDSTHIQRLADILSDYFGQPVKVHINLQPMNGEAETPAVYDERIRQERKAEAIAKLHSDPIVQTLQKEFGGVVDEETVTYK